MTWSNERSSGDDGSRPLRRARAVFEVARAELALAFDAWFRPHGGEQRITVVCRPRGGAIRSVRIPRDESKSLDERELTAGEVESVRAMLEEFCVWQLEDRREPIRDGLRCEVGMVDEHREQAFEFVGIGEDSPHSNVFAHCVDLLDNESASSA